jgi:hypothetical protein
MPDGSVGKVTVRGARHVELLREGESWKLVVEHSRGLAVMRGDEALRALGAFTTAVLSHGAPAEFVSAAIDLMERVGGPARAIHDCPLAVGYWLNRSPVHAEEVRQPRDVLLLPANII